MAAAEATIVTIKTRDIIKRFILLQVFKGYSSCFL